MATTNDLKNGITLNLDGNLWTVVEFQHVKPGKGGAFVRTKLKNVTSGKVVDRTFNAGTKVDTATVDKRSMTFLYREGDEFVFMDGETFDQTTLSTELAGDLMLYIKEGNNVKVVFHGDKPLSVELPKTVELEVVDTEPSVKGATAAAQYKPATLETGLKITVPPFIAIGEKIAVDTEHGKYLSRVK